VFSDLIALNAFSIIKLTFGARSMIIYFVVNLCLSTFFQSTILSFETILNSKMEKGFGTIGQTLVSTTKFLQNLKVYSTIVQVA
jgi:hypothetical protein